MELFYLPILEVGKMAVLSPEESRHCLKVLRHKNGDTIQLTDGKGGLFTGVIREEDLRACQVEIVYRNDDFSNKNFLLHIAVAPTKNIDRFEWFCEKATEIGITSITPLICQRSERKIVKKERVERVLVAAIKQSLKTLLPQINETTPFVDFIAIDFGDAQKFICSGSAKPSDTIGKLYRKGENAVILVGPEGDFAAEELEQAQKAGYKMISLGTSRLRTETAALVACHSIHLLNTFTG